jgi:hypothetical protein
MAATGSAVNQNDAEEEEDKSDKALLALEVRLNHKMNERALVVSVLYPKVVTEEYPDLDVTQYDFTKCETRNNGKGPYFKKDVIAAAIYTGGVYAEMARLLGRSRGRVKEYVEGNPDVADVLDEVRESALDYLEQGVVVSALMGDQQDRRFVLQTLGKNRGFTTRSEHTGKDGEAIEHTMKPVDEILGRLDQMSKRREAAPTPELESGDE